MTAVTPISFPRTLDIAFCINRRHFAGAMAAMHSIVANTDRPQALSFHFTVYPGESPELLGLIDRCFPAPVFQVEVKEFHPSPFLEEYIRAAKDLTYSTHESQVMNFSRFFLDDLYPELDKIIYLDADLIVQADIAELWHLARLEEHLLAASPFATFRSWTGGFNEDSEHLQHIDFTDPVFNIGVYITNLKSWKERQIQQRLRTWIETHRHDFKAFVFGTQALLNVALYREFQQLPTIWNLVPLGLDDQVPQATLESAKILHWAGDRKPWAENGLYKNYWLKYAFDAESLTGTQT